MTVNILDRQSCLKTLALADADKLGKYLSQIEFPTYKVIRKAETGLVMVRARVGNTGNAFNMGELLVTRCSIVLKGVVGHGYVAGNDPLQAENVAVCDALYQLPEFYPAISKILKKLEARRQRVLKQQNMEIAATKVDFFTLVRGED